MTTGKNKEQFEKWYKSKPLDDRTNPYTPFTFKGFLLMPFEIQIRVYFAYYDSLGMKVYTMGSISEEKLWSCSIWMDGDFEELIEEYNFKSRNEAYKEAFKKANELINKK